jgi:hypothetical protein
VQCPLWVFIEWLFAQHLLTYVPLAGHIKRVLDERAAHRAPASRFRDELEDYIPEESAEQTLRAIISWARYGEAFAYDEDSGVRVRPDWEDHLLRARLTQPTFRRSNPMSRKVKSGHPGNFGFESALPQRADMARQPDI